MRRLIAIGVVLFIFALEMSAFADPNLQSLAASLVIFRAEIPFRNEVRTVAASALIVKKIVQDERTILYVIVPPGPIFDNNLLNIQQAAKYISVNNLEFVADYMKTVCWSAETVPLKVEIKRESRTYIPAVYDQIIKGITAVSQWPTGNRYPSTNARYWVIGYDFVGDVWELVKVKAVVQEVRYIGSDISATDPNRVSNRPVILYRFKGPNVKAAATAGNIIVDETGTVVAIVLDTLEVKQKDKSQPPDLYVSAIPSQPVYECLKAFFNGANITFP